MHIAARASSQTASPDIPMSCCNLLRDLRLPWHWLAQTALSLRPCTHKHRPHEKHRFFCVFVSIIHMQTQFWPLAPNVLIVSFILGLEYLRFWLPASDCASETAANFVNSYFYMFAHKCSFTIQVYWKTDTNTKFTATYSRAEPGPSVSIRLVFVKTTLSSAVSCFACTWRGRQLWWDKLSVLSEKFAMTQTPVEGH